MKRLILLSIFTLIFSLVSLENCLASNLIDNKYVEINLASDVEYLEIISISDCFKTYIYFLNKAKLGNEEDGLAFLTRSFSEEIALNILDYYTCTNIDNRLAIKPQEGIPLFTKSDIPRTSFFKEEERITLKIDYYNCFELNDHYIYYITAYKDKGRYIINDLNWQKVSPQVLHPCWELDADLHR